MIRAVLFDMDGILFDSEMFYLEGTYKWMKSLGFEGDISLLYPIIGQTMDGLYDYLYKCLGHNYSLETIKDINEAYFTLNKPDASKILFEGVRESLIELKTMGLQLGVCSSSKESLIKDFLKEAQILDYFDILLSSDNMVHGKPDPEIYLKAIQLLKRRAEECIIYEDSNAGIQSGKKSGAFVIARQDDRYDTDQSGADVIVKNAREMVDIVRDMYGRSY